MKLLFTLVFVCLISSNTLVAQIIENPFEKDNTENFLFYDFDVFDHKITLIGTDEQQGSIDMKYIRVFSLENSLWKELKNTLVFESKLIFISTGLSWFSPISNPKIRYDNLGNLWLSGNSLFKRINENWVSYNAPKKLDGYDSTISQVIHEIYFDKQNVPSVSSLITTKGPDFTGLNIGVFEIFKLDNDTLRHTRINDKIAMIKTSYTHLVDESKMTIVNDTMVVYKSNGMFYFVNTDFSYDSIAFAGYNGKTSSNLEIRQIQPDGGLDKLWILADKSPTISSELCCSGIYLLENKKQWTILNESNGMPKNTDGTFYSPRSIIALPNGNHLVAVSPDTNSGKFSRLYTIDASNKLTRISLENLLINAKVFPRRRFSRGITQEMFTKIFTAIRTDTVSEPIPYTEILKIRLDGRGNLWWMMKDCIVMIPAFIPTSVSDENSSNVPLLVSPNPANNTISLSSVPRSCDKIEIVSVHGEIVQTVFSGYGNINIQSLPSGVYLLKMHTKSGIQTTTFVKEF